MDDQADNVSRGTACEVRKYRAYHELQNGWCAGLSGQVCPPDASVLFLFGYSLALEEGIRFFTLMNELRE